MSKPLPASLVPNLAGARDAFLHEAQQLLARALPAGGNVVVLHAAKGADHSDVMLHVRSAHKLGVLTLALMDALADEETDDGNHEQARAIAAAQATGNLVQFPHRPRHASPGGTAA